MPQYVRGKEQAVTSVQDCIMYSALGPKARQKLKIPVPGHGKHRPDVKWSVAHPCTETPVVLTQYRDKRKVRSARRTHSTALLVWA